MCIEECSNHILAKVFAQAVCAVCVLQAIHCLVHTHMPCRRQLIVVHDGGTLGLDWFRGSDAWDYAAPETPILLVLHGINGNKDPYSQNTEVG